MRYGGFSRIIPVWHVLTVVEGGFDESSHQSVR